MVNGQMRTFGTKLENVKTYEIGATILVRCALRPIIACPCSHLPEMGTFGAATAVATTIANITALVTDQAGPVSLEPGGVGCV